MALLPSPGSGTRKRPSRRPYGDGPPPSARSPAPGGGAGCRTRGSAPNPAPCDALRAPLAPLPPPPLLRSHLPLFAPAPLPMRPAVTVSESTVSERCQRQRTSQGARAGCGWIRHRHRLHRARFGEIPCRRGVPISIPARSTADWSSPFRICHRLALPRTRLTSTSPPLQKADEKPPSLSSPRFPWKG